jgi:hypothetical protein
MRKRQLKIGQVVPGTRLRVLEHLESDLHGNQRVRVRCEWIVNGDRCGVEKPMRVTDMTRKPYVDKNGKARLPHRSCGCQSRRAHREFWERRAKAIPVGARRTIFMMLEDKRSLESVASQRRLPVTLVATIYRLELQRLRPAFERWVAWNVKPGTTAGVREWREFIWDAKVRFTAMVKRERRLARQRKRRGVRCGR